LILIGLGSLGLQEQSHDLKTAQEYTASNPDIKPKLLKPNPFARFWI
jgi:hypothetical protein